MITYSDFLKENIDLAPLGFCRDRNCVAYYCTPKNANILGSAGVDGPTAVFVSSGSCNSATHHIALSALHFEPVDDIEWKIIFREKPLDDIEVEYIL